MKKSASLMAAAAIVFAGAGCAMANETTMPESCAFLNDKSLPVDTADPAYPQASDFQSCLKALYEPYGVIEDYILFARQERNTQIRTEISAIQQGIEELEFRTRQQREEDYKNAHGGELPFSVRLEIGRDIEKYFAPMKNILNAQTPPETAKKGGCFGSIGFGWADAEINEMIDGKTQANDKEISYLFYALSQCTQSIELRLRADGFSGGPFRQMNTDDMQKWDRLPGPQDAAGYVQNIQDPSDLIARSHILGDQVNEAYERVTQRWCQLFKDDPEAPGLYGKGYPDNVEGNKPYYETSCAGVPAFK